MPPYRWISIRIECRDRGIEGEVIRPTRDTKDVSLHLGNQEAHNLIDPPIETPHQEGHASNVDRWATTRETARGERNKKELPSLTPPTQNQLASHLLLYHETTWPR